MSRIRRVAPPIRWNAVTASVTQGVANQTIKLASFLSNSQNRTVTYSVATGTLPTGLTLNSTTGVITYDGASPVAAASVQFRATTGAFSVDSLSATVSIVAPAQNNALTDWIARSTAPGVFWANRFNDASSDAWIMSGEDASQQVKPDLASPAGAAFVASLARARRIATDGIIGDGCCEIFVPAGSYPGTATFWRPLSPVLAANAGPTTDKAYPADINNGGATAFNLENHAKGNSAPWTAQKKLAGNVRGACFGAAQYFDPTVYLDANNFGAPEFTYAGPFWIQFRIKISASKGSTASPGGKLMMLEHVGGGTCMHELVIGIRGGQSMPYIDSGAAPYFYTGQGKGYGSLENPQKFQNTAGQQMQPGGDYPNCTRDNFASPTKPWVNKCWAWPLDTWVTVMIGVTPGTNNIPLDGTPFGDGGYSWNEAALVRDTGIVLKVAAQGATRWTTLCNKSDFFWWYAGSISSNWSSLPVGHPGRTTSVPWGWNSFRLTQYNGGGNQTLVTADEVTRLDQIICSKNEIPLPAV